ncbi:hypothetical protein [Oceanicoccus sp. KOV_DT_Chl]|uniref:hypothetical protein n=1 Tax=Oceanicoccus sp. KOV_DT_Chl TaxID=1904639 RepID=UPI000C7CE8F0|nr:hypothetical protein [Oceanicoccus sp. KOV_DT_Chl]
MERIFKTPPALVCRNNCGSVLRLEDFFPELYFEGITRECPTCGQKIDVWSHAIELLQKKAQLFRNKGAAFIGGEDVSFTFQLPPNKTVEVDLTDYGVPDDAKLIYVVYTPFAGAGWPIEMHGNQPIQHRTTNKMTFFGKPMPKSGNEVGGHHDVSMSVTYIPKSQEQTPFTNLANAYELFMLDKFSEMIIPCAVALEYSIERVTAYSLQASNLPDNLKPSKRLSLEVILPLICKTHNIPTLNNEITELVIRLWSLRNQMAHDGELKQHLTHAEASKILAAAMFCINYFGFLSGRVQNSQS